MISDAINESDRLSSCNKRVRKRLAPDAGVFQVYSVLIGSGGNGDDRAGVDAGTEEMRLNYNVGGICLSEPAFRKLQQEIALSPAVGTSSSPALTDPGSTSSAELFVGTVPVSTGVFRTNCHSPEPDRSSRHPRSLDIAAGPISATTKSVPTRRVRRPGRRAIYNRPLAADAQALPQRFRNFAEPEMESLPPLRARTGSPLVPRAQTSIWPGLSTRKNPNVRPRC